MAGTLAGSGHGRIDPARLVRLARQNRCSSGFTERPPGAPAVLAGARRAVAPAEKPPPAVLTRAEELLLELHRLADAGVALPSNETIADVLGADWTSTKVAVQMDRLIEERRIVLRHGAHGAPRSLVLADGRMLFSAWGSKRRAR